jgi:hypothetical protein
MDGLEAVSKVQGQTPQQYIDHNVRINELCIMKLA